MKKLLLIISLLPMFLFTGCLVSKPTPYVPRGQNFSIESNLNDKFADKGITILKTIGNRISPISPSISYLTTSNGVYINAGGVIDTNIKGVGFGFRIDNYFNTYYGVDRGFRPIKGVIFIVDNYKRIELDTANYEESYSLNYSYSEYFVHSDFEESAIFVVSSREDFEAIVNAKRLDVKIVGSQSSMSYYHEDIMELEPYFISNLKKFYETFKALEKEVMAN